VHTLLRYRQQLKKSLLPEADGDGESGRLSPLVRTWLLISFVRDQCTCHAINRRAFHAFSSRRNSCTSPSQLSAVTQELGAIAHQARVRARTLITPRSSEADAAPAPM